MNISVVIPLYNKKNSILGTLDSIFKQTFLPREIIVINDGSTDGSEKIVQELNHPLIRLFHQTNAGVSAARNRGIQESTGDWIAFLDADDEWKPEYLGSIKKLRKKYPEAKILASSYLIKVGRTDYRKSRLNFLNFNGSDGILNDYFKTASYSEPPLWTSATVVKKEILTIACCFPVGIKSGEDLITWARLAIKYQIALTTTNLAVFNLYRDISSVEKKPDYPDYVGKELRIMVKQNPQNKSLKAYYSWYKKNRAMHAFLSGQRFEFLKNLMLSLPNDINPIKTLLTLVLFFIPLSTYQKFRKKI